MNKIILIVTICLIVIGCKKAQPNIKFQNTKINVGTINPSQLAVKAKFVFTNTGDEPLVLKGVASDCSCTIASFSKQPIYKNEKGVINIDIKPEAIFAKGNFQRKIVVQSNTNPQLHTLILSMFIPQ